MSETGLQRYGEVVILTGPALKAMLECARIAIQHRKHFDLPYQAFEALACESRAAMAVAGHSDVRIPAISKAVQVEPPTVPLDEVIALLDVSDRHARRLAQKLGGRKIGGRWFVDEMALREHIGGRQQQ